MLISVRLLYFESKRLSAHAVKIQRGRVGWLVLEPSGFAHDSPALQARLVDAHGLDLLAVMDRARVSASGARGMKLEGVEYRAKGRKHSRQERQAWWCQAPPAEAPLIDHARRVEEADRLYLAKLANPDF